MEEGDLLQVEQYSGTCIAYFPCILIQQKGQAQSMTNDHHHYLQTKNIDWSTYTTAYYFDETVTNAQLIWFTRLYLKIRTL